MSWRFAGEESWESSSGVRERTWDSHAVVLAGDVPRAQVSREGSPKDLQQMEFAQHISSTRGPEG